MTLPPDQRPALRPTWVDLWEAVASFAGAVLGLGIGIAAVEGVSAPNPWSVPLAALVVFVLTWVLAAPLRWVADRLGGAVAFVLGITVQVVAMWLALHFLPGLRVASWWSAVLVLLVAGLVAAVVSWLVGASDSDYVVGDVLRRGRRREAQRRRAVRQGRTEPDGRPPGLLVVILDGVAEPVLRHAVDAGMAPTVAHWLAQGTHRLETWWAQVPATTPASTAGLLHGKADHIPAFRWWDEALGRLVVTNHPWDAATVEAAFSDGEGLLAHDGAAIATVFSGDAPTTQLVMSRTIGHRVRGHRVGSVYVRFFASPLVFARSLVLTAGEVVKELYQARLARVRGVEPRISRGGWYVLLRAVTNVTLRGLNTSLVAEHMERGTPTIAVDFVDYDEIAHHAGPVRPESLRSLEGLDGALRTLATVGAAAPRDYRIVVVSDHGQSLGATFEQVAGHTLTELVTSLMRADGAGDVAVATIEAGEDWGPLNALLNEIVAPMRGRSTVRGPEGRDARAVRDGVVGETGGVGEAGADSSPGAVPTPRVSPAEKVPVAVVPLAPGDPDAVAVIASGNLSLIWFTGLPGRVPLVEIQERWPSLVAGLAAHPSVGVVVVDSTRGLLAVGADGVRDLEPAVDGAEEGDDGAAPRIEGADPLRIFADPDAAARDLARAARLPHTGDLLLVSAVDGERVNAFEHQVGSHGGLGGDQNRATLLTPVDLPRDGEPVIGADAVFHLLRDYQRALGLRP